MARKTKEQLQAELMSIRTLRRAYKKDADIIKQLNIPESTYWYYIKLINKQDKKIYEKQLKEDISSDLIMLKDTFLTGIEECNAVIKNPESKPGDVLEAIRLRSEIHVNIVKLKREGPQIFNGFTPGTKTETSSSKHEGTPEPAEQFIV